MALTDVLVVSHTHWDREWYHSADEFRSRLIRLIDELIDQPPAPGASFLLDGQAVLLDDYLAVRPERAAALSALLREGRIEAGPWYVLADELIPSGEALVRNLLIGRDTVSRLRGSSPQVLYCPDSFGHPAMLPAIAAGFGCTVVLLWRGLGGARSPKGDCMRWRSADGSSALLYHLPPDGYEYGSSLPASVEHARERWSRIGDVLGARAATPAAILLNGADHHARQRDLEGALQVLGETAAPIRVRHSSLRAAADALLSASAGASLPEITGELRDSYGYTWTLGGTLGTRAHQKRANARAERLLVRDVEPWLALLPSGADATSRSLLTAAWRTLLLAHPHDTLCGTSIDTVATAMDGRVQSASEQAQSLRQSAMHSLVHHDVERARRNTSDWRPALVLRNPAPRARGGIVELTLRAKLADVAVGPGSATRQGVASRPAAVRIEGMALQVLSRRGVVELTESPRAYPDADKIIELTAVGWMPTPVGGYTARTLLHRGRERPAVPNPVIATQAALANGLLRVEVGDDGVVTLHDITENRTVPNAVHFERAEDVGDLYTPAIRNRLAPPEFVRARLVHRGPIRGAIALEFRIGKRRARAAGQCTVLLQLDANSRALAIDVHGDNSESDHRLRLVIGGGLPDAATIADAAFSSVVRRLPHITEQEAAMEHVVPTAPLQRWVGRFAGEQGLLTVSDGLAEYEAMADGGVAVTLVRSVGQLSRHDLPERPGHAGWPAPTPGAQCIGPYAGRLWLQCVGGESPATRAEMVRIVDDFLLPLTGDTLRSNCLDAEQGGGLELHGAGLEFSAATPAREPGWVTLRCFNHSDERASGEWQLRDPVAEAWRSRLDETPLERLAVNGNAIAFVAEPREIVTILARR